MGNGTRKAGNREKLGNLMLIMAAMIWGTAFVAQRQGMETIEPITFAAARMVLSAAVVGLVALLTSRGSKLSTADRARRRRASIAGCIGCGVFLALGSVTQQMGLVTTTAGKAGFITAMYMLFVPVVNFILFRKKTTWVVWLAVLIGLTGMFLLCVNEDFRLERGDAMVFACALLFTGHILCCDHFAPLGDPIVISAIQCLTAALICGAGAFALEEPTWAKVASAAVPIAYCGFMSGGVGFTLQIVAQRFTDPTVASLLMSLESVFAAIAGALLIGERMRPRELVGCVVMFAAILLVQLPVGRRGKGDAEI